MTNDTTQPREQADQRALTDLLDEHWLSGGVLDRVKQLLLEREMAIEGKHPIQQARAAQAAPEAPTSWISDVVRDIAELPDRDSPDGQPDMMLVTVNELHDIIGRHAPTGAAPEAPTATLRTAYDALRFYVDASDTELAERGITRNDALRLARDAEIALVHGAPATTASTTICPWCEKDALAPSHKDGNVQNYQCGECLNFSHAATTASASGDALADLLTCIDDAHENYERFGQVCEFEGQPMIYASTLHEIIEARGNFHVAAGAPAPSRNAAPLDEHVAFNRWFHGSGFTKYMDSMWAAWEARAALTQQGAAQPLVRPLDDPKMAAYLRNEPWISAYIETLECELRKVQAAHAGAAEKPLAHGHREDYYLLVNARRLAHMPITRIMRMQNWQLASELFATGSNSARQICIDAGIDPDATTSDRAALAATEKKEQK